MTDDGVSAAAAASPDSKAASAAAASPDGKAASASADNAVADAASSPDGKAATAAADNAASLAESEEQEQEQGLEKKKKKRKLAVMAESEEQDLELEKKKRKLEASAESREMEEDSRKIEELTKELEVLVYRHKEMMFIKSVHANQIIREVQSLQLTRRICHPDCTPEEHKEAMDQLHKVTTLCTLYEQINLKGYQVYLDKFGTSSRSRRRASQPDPPTTAGAPTSA